MTRNGPPHSWRTELDIHSVSKQNIVNVRDGEWVNPRDASFDKHVVNVGR